MSHRAKKGFWTFADSVAEDQPARPHSFIWELHCPQISQWDLEPVVHNSRWPGRSGASLSAFVRRSCFAWHGSNEMMSSAQIVTWRLVFIDQVSGTGNVIHDAWYCRTSIIRVLVWYAMGLFWAWIWMSPIGTWVWSRMSLIWYMYGYEYFLATGLVCVLILAWVWYLPSLVWTRLECESGRPGPGSTKILKSVIALNSNNRLKLNMNMNMTSAQSDLRATLSAYKSIRLHFIE